MQARCCPDWNADPGCFHIRSWRSPPMPLECVNSGDRPPTRQPPAWRTETRSHDRHREASSTELLANCACSRPHPLRLRTANVNRSYLTSDSAWPPALWAEPHAEGPPRAILLGFQSSLPVEGD